MNELWICELNFELVHVESELSQHCMNVFKHCEMCYFNQIGQNISYNKTQNGCESRIFDSGFQPGTRSPLGGLSKLPKGLKMTLNTRKTRLFT